MKNFKLLKTNSFKIILSFLFVSFLTFSMSGQTTKNQEREDYLKEFLNRNPHYKKDLHKFTFYDHSYNPGLPAPHKPNYRAYTKEFVFDKQYKVEYMSGGRKLVGTLVYIMYPVISLKSLGNLSIYYVIQKPRGNSGLKIVNSSFCELLKQ